jgi:hypothetical protein
MMKRIDSAHLLRAVSDEAWAAIDKAMQSGGTIDDVLTAAMLVHVAIATERRFGNWCAQIRDIQLQYLDGLAFRLQEIDDGEVAHTMAAAGVIKLAREACGD